MNKNDFFELYNNIDDFKGKLYIFKKVLNKAASKACWTSIMIGDLLTFENM